MPMSQTVSLIELKSMARTLLKPGSTVREMLLSEPDSLPVEVGRVKAEMYIELFAKERSNVRFAN